MQRVINLFAISAVVILLFGTVVSRVIPATGLTFTWSKATYLVPNTLLCYGIGFVLAFFAFLYSVPWFAWGIRGAEWHLVLSILLVVVFFGCSMAFDRLSDTQQNAQPMVPLLVAVVISPLLFGILQVSFGVDALRRVIFVFHHK